MLGVCYINQSKFKKRKLFTKTLLKIIRKIIGIYILKCCKYGIGEIENAKRYLEKVISLMKYFAKAKRLLEQINAQINKKTN